MAPRKIEGEGRHQDPSIFRIDESCRAQGPTVNAVSSL
jgi:hypothetical protein